LNLSVGVNFLADFLFTSKSQNFSPLEAPPGRRHPSPTTAIGVVSSAEVMIKALWGKLKLEVVYDYSQND
jgi:hypothetical protein